MSEPQEIVTVWPDFAEDFACKADRCQHSCCRGWEIDIDAATAAYYASLEGPLGEALRENIDVLADGTHAFHLTVDEHCPFLREDGLCRLIREIGEEALCEVCTMHPRFFIMSGTVELAGFGLACEKAVELLLSADSLRLRAEGESQSFDFGALLAFLGKAVPREWLLPPARLTLAQFSFLLAQMKDTEPIDDAWPQQLTALRLDCHKLLPRYAKLLAAQGADAAEKLVSYILYRQLDKAERYGMEALCRYARFNVVFIYLLAAETQDLPEAVRRWSEQIEYDEENTARLIEACGQVPAAFF
ncbi:flagellin lysine-N-methylase [uncultured Mitsuokella sp.]|uniref:flagellin lysine-N-methylase n=1 Tax=uncultured Mitsuokella sp. TaxID=453120 RepID=UPI00266CD4B1|nr:flagellin lysine-N-methylase [uncultured Mitsuokella sp.]